MKRASIADAPAILNTNDKAMWVLGFNAAAEQQASKPLTHEQAKALAERYGNDPLNLIFQTEKHHGITGEEA